MYARSRVRLRAQRLRLLHLFPASLHVVLVGTVPDLVELAHRDAPVRHGAIGIGLRDALKLRPGLLIPEIVQQGDAAVERRLLLRRARNGERNRAQPLARSGLALTGMDMADCAAAARAEAANRQNAVTFIFGPHYRSAKIGLVAEMPGTCRTGRIPGRIDSA